VLPLNIDNINSLYDLDVHTFRYKEGYIETTDERYLQDIPGLIAEELDGILPIAVDHINGNVEMWNNQVLVPCLLKLIQDLNNRLKKFEV